MDRVRCRQSGSALGAQSSREGKARQVQKLGRGLEEDTGENESLNLSICQKAAARASLNTPAVL